jgi:hypothetical protein
MRLKPTMPTYSDEDAKVIADAVIVHWQYLAAKPSRMDELMAADLKRVSSQIVPK